MISPNSSIFSYFHPTIKINASNHILSGTFLNHIVYNIYYIMKLEELKLENYTY